MNDINYRKTVNFLYDSGLKNRYFTSVDVSMLGYGCGLSQYPLFYVKYLDIYQVLTRPYIGSFDGFPGDKLISRNGCWTSQVKHKHFSGDVLKPG